MKQVETIHAVGHVLCHDITVIVKDVKKGVAFKKGHVVREEDVPELLKLGKDHLYVWEKDDDMLHEDDAAAILRDICLGENITATEAHEGKIELNAAIDGLFTIRRDKMMAVNSIEEIMIASRHGFIPVKKGDKLCGTRVIPLVIAKEKMERVKAAAGSEPLMNVLPFRPLRCGIVTTGSEVFYGRIQDTFTPVVKAKVEEYGMTVIGHERCPDDKELITAAVLKLRDMGCELILTTGGMSVDPDDKTPGAIKATGARIVTYGAPVLPGAMMLVGYLPGKDGSEEIPVIGLPGCVMYAKRTIFDLVLPRVCAGIPVSREDLVAFGEGGLCLNCPVCTWPNCGFGK